jgi:type I restriction enzyme S subunit
MLTDLKPLTELRIYPEGWSETTLETVVAVNPESLGIGTPQTFQFQYIDISSVTSGAINWNTVIIQTFATSPSRARRIVRPKDVLLCTVRPALQAHAFANWQDKEGYICSTGFAVLRAGSEVYPRYLYHLIFSDIAVKQLRKLEIGSNYPAVNESDIRLLRIPLPSFPEQCGIADILDTIDSTIAHTSSLIAKLKQMKAGLLHDLLTRGLDENGELRDAIGHPEQFKDSPLGRIPKDWEAEPFGGHIAQLDSGWSPVCDSEPAANGEWGILKTTAVVWSGYNPLENKKLPSNLQPRYQAVVEADDILITRKGPRERVGVVVHIPLTPPQLMMPDTVFRVRLKESSTLLPAFVPLTLGSIVVQRDWNRKKIGLAEAQVDINYGIVRETLIYIPPKPEQERIVGIINNYNTRIRTEEAYRDKLKLQKKGLMHDLLTGKVRIKDADKFTPASDTV